MAASRQRDEAHAALMAAVERRRRLLDSVDGELIADSIENRVQRSKMLQTVYKADNNAVQRSPTGQPAVGLLSVTDTATKNADDSNSNGDFMSEAEQARLEYVRRLQSPPTQTKQPPPLTKPVRSLPPKSSQDGGGRTPGSAEPPPVPRRSTAVNESHNRALAAYVNGSSRIYTAAVETTAGYTFNKRFQF